MNFNDALLSGSDEDCERAMEGDECLIVDHRSEEPEVLDEFVRLLPGFSFSHHVDAEGVCHVETRFRDRTSVQRYGITPYNCFRIVRDVEALIQPEASVRVYTPTIGDDTHIFVVRDNDFWARFDREASPSRKEMFSSINFLERAWELSGPVKRQKKWWQLWK